MPHSVKFAAAVVAIPLTLAITMTGCSSESNAPEKDRSDSGPTPASVPQEETVAGVTYRVTSAEVCDMDDRDITKSNSAYSDAVSNSVGAQLILADDRSRVCIKTADGKVYYGTPRAIHDDNYWFSAFIEWDDAIDIVSGKTVTATLVNIDWDDKKWINFMLDGKQVDIEGVKYFDIVSFYETAAKGSTRLSWYLA